MPKKENESASDQQKRANLIKTTAKNAKMQGNFALASTLYMQIGEKVKAAKCLVRQGDTETIIKFAENARSPDIYILTANYLQNSDWHNNPNLMKKIIAFYTRAKSYQHLAGFYEACAAVEIDEDRNYERASQALEEALKYLTKATMDNREARQQAIEQKKFYIDKFVEAKQLAQTSPQQCLQACQQLLGSISGDSGVRAGDIYAQMIELFYHQGQGEPAYRLIQQMEERGITVHLYLDREMVRVFCWS